VWWFRGSLRSHRGQLSAEARRKRATLR
jgi:hypothetical protein